MAARLATAALAGVTIVLCLLVAEWGVRRFVDESAFSPRGYRIPDETFGWVLQPNARYTYEHDGHAIPVAYNARGYRDVAHAVAKPPGVRRIAVLGDSFMEAYSVRLEESLARRLEGRLSREERPVEVLNFGVGGYGTLQQYRVFREHARAYQPDVVLLGFFLKNDIHDNSLELETYRKPGTRAGERRPFLLPEPGWQTNSVDAETSWRLYRAARERYDTWWWQAGQVSRLWGLTGARWLLSLHEALHPDEEGEVEQTDADRAARDAMQEALFSCETPPEYQRAWEITERILGRLAREVADAGAQLVVFSVPSTEETNAPDTAEARARCLHDLPGWAHLRAALERHGIPFVDLRPAFRAEAQTRALFFEDDPHWNAAGHALAVKVLAGEVERRLGGGATRHVRGDGSGQGADRPGVAAGAGARGAF